MEKLPEGQRARSCYCLGHSVCPAAFLIPGFRGKILHKGRWGGKTKQVPPSDHTLPAWSYRGTWVVLSSR